MAQPLIPLTRQPVQTTDVTGRIDLPIGLPPTAISADGPPTAEVRPVHDAEACANALLDLLPKHIAEYAREIAYVHNRQPLWAVVAGHVLKAYENGDLQAPVLDPSWPRRFTNLPVDPRNLTYTCEWKGGAKGTHEFSPRRYKQRFCSNECGAEAAMAPKPLVSA